MIVYNFVTALSPTPSSSGIEEGEQYTHPAMDPKGLNSTIKANSKERTKKCGVEQEPSQGEEFLKGNNFLFHCMRKPWFFKNLRIY